MREGAFFTRSGIQVESGRTLTQAELQERLEHDGRMESAVPTS